MTETGTPTIAKNSLNLISGRDWSPRTKIPHSGREEFQGTGPIYYGGRWKPSHGFSRSLSVMVMAKWFFALLLCLERRAVRHKPCFEIAPKRDHEFACYRHDDDTTDAPLQAARSLLEPTSESALRLIT